MPSEVQHASLVHASVLPNSHHSSICNETRVMGDHGSIHCLKRIYQLLPPFLQESDK